MKVIYNTKNLGNSFVEDIVRKEARFESSGYAVILDDSDDPRRVMLTSSSPGLDLLKPPIPAKYFNHRRGEETVARVVIDNGKTRAIFLVPGKLVSEL